ncbi:MAG: RNA 2',3'-cyclic phosphodiesterase [Pseudomonadota bacterium]
MRAFVALDLPESWRDDLECLQVHLRTGRVVPAENLHLTLAFLGDVSEAVLEEIHESLDHVPKPGIRLRILGLDLFGSATAPRLVCAVVDDSQILRDLQSRVARLARSAGLDLERRRFRPHVTLARFGRTARADPMALSAFLADHGGFHLPETRFHAMGLYASTLRPDGAEYQALGIYPLAP